MAHGFVVELQRQLVSRCLCPRISSSMQGIAMRVSLWKSHDFQCTCLKSLTVLEPDICLIFLSECTGATQKGSRAIVVSLCLSRRNSVIHWAFNNPQPFPQIREFLWQEDGTAHVTNVEGDNLGREILDLTDACIRIIYSWLFLRFRVLDLKKRRILQVDYALRLRIYNRT